MHLTTRIWGRVSSLTLLCLLASPCSLNSGIASHGLLLSLSLFSGHSFFGPKI